jgi:nicotinamidase-related amidase
LIFITYGGDEGGSDSAPAARPRVALVVIVALLLSEPAGENQTGLDWYLNGIGVLPGDTLIIIGAMTNVCVHYGTVGAHQRDYHVRVVEECVAGSTRKAHEAALEQIEYLQTGARANLADVLEAVREYVPIRPQNPGAFSGLTPELAH